MSCWQWIYFKNFFPESHLRTNERTCQTFSSSSSLVSSRFWLCDDDGDRSLMAVGLPTIFSSPTFASWAPGVRSPGGWKCCRYPPRPAWAWASWRPGSCWRWLGGGGRDPRRRPTLRGSRCWPLWGWFGGATGYSPRSEANLRKNEVLVQINF